MATASKTATPDPDEPYGLFEDDDKRQAFLGEQNEKFLDEFERWLQAKGLSASTIDDHLINASFYLNTYLMRDLIGMEEGPGLLDDFLGNFFIRKCMWSTPQTVKSFATSLKKFYQCMENAGHVPAGTYRFVLDEVKGGLPEWQDRCEAYNDGAPIDELFDDLDNPFAGLDDDLMDIDGFGDLDDAAGGDESYLYELMRSTILGILARTGEDDEGGDEGKPSLPPLDFSLLDELSDEDLDEIEADLTLLLLYVTSKRDEATGDRKSRLAFPKDALAMLEDEGALALSNDKKSAVLPQRMHPRAELLLAARLDEREHIAQIVQGIASEFAEIRGALDSVNDDGTCRAFRFRIDLDLDGDRKCWREIVVPANFTFELFHQAIQASFLWWDYHMYDFQLRSRGEKLFIANSAQGGVDAMFAPLGRGTTHVDATKLRLDEVFPKTRTATYSYDYGDGWKHKVKLVETVEGSPLQPPTCLAGEGDAPPEDVGGSYGFERFLEAIEDEGNPEHEHLKEWGWSQFFEPFSLDRVNRRLAKWPTGELVDEWDERHAER